MSVPTLGSSRLLVRLPQPRPRLRALCHCLAAAQRTPPLIRLVVVVSVLDHAKPALGGHGPGGLGRYFFRNPRFFVSLLFFEFFSYLFESDLAVAQRAPIRDIRQLGSEPAVDALRVEEVPAERDLPHHGASLKFFEAHHALGLLEFIYSLVIGHLLYQADERGDSLLVGGRFHLLLILRPRPPVARAILLCYVILLAVAFVADSDDGADAHAGEDEHQHEEYQSDHTEG